MVNDRLARLDVAVIGGGPAGISTCIELSKSSNLKIALFESDAELGGIPRTSHYFFGLRDRKWLYTGPAYAQKLNSLIRKTSVKIQTEATVVNIITGNQGELHRIDVASPEGLNSYESRFIVLATGCCESNRSSRFIPGTRPAGIFTAGTVQELVNLYHLKPGKHALIIGSEHMALSSVLTLRRSGTSIAGIVEENEDIQTYPSIAKTMSLFYGFPIYKSTSVKAILGDKRVEAVELVMERNQKAFQVECDTVIITGKFRPYSLLLENTSIEQDPQTFGPVIDMNLMSSVPNIFAAGNILRGGDMHDLCALEGKQAAKNILRRFESSESKMNEYIPLIVEAPIRYVVPQKIILNQIKSYRSSWLYPGFSIQMEHTLKNTVLEAWSGYEKIWEGSFSKLTANNRIPLPVNKFIWSRVDKEKGVALKVKAARP
jgi:thioredoxin reductase